MVSTINSSFVSPTANAQFAVKVPLLNDGLLSHVAQSITIWNFLSTVLLGLIVYDQCMCIMNIQERMQRSWKLINIIGRYIYNKGGIAGTMLKIPFMGPFLESVFPKMDSYKAKWASGDLSCVSVFHKCVSMSQLAPPTQFLQV